MFVERYYLIVADIIDSECRMLSLSELKNKFNIHINILNYYTVRIKVNLYLEKTSPRKNWNLQRPVCPRHLDIILKSSKGCKGLYDAFNKVTSAYQKPLSETIWDNSVQNENSDKPFKDTWNIIVGILLMKYVLTLFLITALSGSNTAF